MYQRLGRGEIKVGVAPLQLAQRGKAVVLDGACHLIIQRARLACDAKGAIRHATPRAACDLRQFIGGQLAHSAAIEFGQGRKGHMVDIQIQPHANGVGGHQIINLAILIKRHLGIARARA